MSFTILIKMGNNEFFDVLKLILKTNSSISKTPNKTILKNKKI